MIRQLWLVAGVCVAVAVPVLGQGSVTSVKTLSFDVVTIKPNKSGGNMVRMQNMADRFSATGISVKSLIQNAYGIKTGELISGVPGWADSERFDVEAKMDEESMLALKKLPPEQAEEQRRLMTQAMLAERFGLKVHKESKEVPIYALVIAKGGSKLKEADPNNTYPNGVKGPDGVSRGGMMMVRNGMLTAQGIPISNLVGNLSGQVHRIVVDKTGLTGKYDVTLQWAPDEIQGAMGSTGGPEGQPGAAPPAASGPSIFTALQEQLGLKLESSKGPADLIVVDHVEMPSEN